MTANDAEIGGGIVNHEEAVLDGCIVAANTAAVPRFGRERRVRFLRLKFDRQCWDVRGLPGGPAGWHGHGSLGIRLDPLSPNGGPDSWTHLPQPGSPALSQANWWRPPERDQRGLWCRSHSRTWDLSRSWGMFQVSGIVFDDKDADGEQDPAELGVAGVRVYADLNNNGRLDADEWVETTLADGSYAMDLIEQQGIAAIQILGQDGYTLKFVPDDETAGLGWGPNGRSGVLLDVGDINGDGNLDLITSTWGRTRSTWRRTKGMDFQSAISRRRACKCRPRRSVNLMVTKTWTSS